MTTSESKTLTTRQQAWLYVMRNAMSRMEDAAASRRSRYGVALGNDVYARRWRLADRRMQRASLALTGWPHLSRPSGAAHDPELVARWWWSHRDELRRIKQASGD